MNNLRVLRERKGITQLRLGIAADVSQETISGYELGKTMPSVETLCKMADFLNTSTDYLLDRTSIPTPVNRLPVSGLSPDELELITQYKSLSKAQKNKVVGFLMGLLE